MIPELSKQLCDASRLNSPIEQLIQLFRPCSHLDDLRPLQMHFRGCGETCGNQLHCFELDFVCFLLGDSLDIAQFFPEVKVDNTQKSIKA